MIPGRMCSLCVSCATCEWVGQQKQTRTTNKRRICSHEHRCGCWPRDRLPVHWPVMAHIRIDLCPHICMPASGSAHVTTRCAPDPGTDPLTHKRVYPSHGAMPSVGAAAPGSLPGAWRCPRAWLPPSASFGPCPLGDTPRARLGGALCTEAWGMLATTVPARPR